MRITKATSEVNSDSSDEEPDFHKPICTPSVNLDSSVPFHVSTVTTPSTGESASALSSSRRVVWLLRIGVLCIVVSFPLIAIAAVCGGMGSCVSHTTQLVENDASGNSNSSNTFAEENNARGRTNDGNQTDPTSAPSILLKSISPYPTFHPAHVFTASPTREAGRPTNVAAFINSVTLSGRTIIFPAKKVSNISVEESALRWLIVNDPLQLSPDSMNHQQRLRQRYALRTLFEWSYGNEAGSSPSVASWHNATGWNNDDDSVSRDECQWFGIVCSDAADSSIVTEINLPYNDLACGIPTELGLLTALTQVDLRFYSLTGSLPLSIGRWTLLRSLDIGSNFLSGSIPESVGNWREIRSAIFDTIRLLARCRQRWASGPMLTSFDSI